MREPGSREPGSGLASCLLRALPGSGLTAVAQVLALVLVCLSGREARGKWQVASGKWQDLRNGRETGTWQRP